MLVDLTNNSKHKWSKTISTNLLHLYKSLRCLDLEIWWLIFCADRQIEPITFNPLLRMRVQG